MFTRFDSFEVTMVDKGEGSRGGKIIGHTKSGKAIHMSSGSPAANNPHFAGFSKGEHLEVSMLHARLNEKWLNLSISAEQKYQYETAAGYTTMAANHDAHREYHSAKSKGDSREDVEGSRGGHIIGHTTSGKPIYMQHHHPGHGGF